MKTRTLMLAALLSSFSAGELAAMESTVLAPLDRERLLADDARESGPVPLRVAVGYPVAIAPTMRQLETIDGRPVWRHAVEVPGATDLSVAFERFDLPPGAELYVYDEAKTQLRGPYTSADRRDHGELWTPVVPGSRAIVELRLPQRVDEAAAKNRRTTAAPAKLPSLRLMQVNAGYRDLFGRDGVPNLTRQLACNIDVACPQADPWRDELRSVTRYTINIGGSTFLCTGQLVMDEPGTLTPYVLTAHHCGPSSATDQTMVFYWNYESPSCGQLGGGSLSEAQIGAIYRASRTNVDFSLVELEEAPDDSFGVYFGGWDATGATPFGGSVGIHHPGGDEKSIAFNLGSAASASICIAGTNFSNGFWFVNWEEGTTEPGSSGSALWNTTNQKIIGYLSGGSSACIGENPNGLSDCYGKVAAAWEGSTNVTQHLKPWLDPNDTGTLLVDGQDPLAGECGDAALNIGESCDDGNTNGGDGCSAICEVETGWECELPINQRGIRDGSFEEGSPNPRWNEFSTNFETPLCTTSACGFGIGSDGIWFAYFGREVDGEVGFLEQDIVIPDDATTLSFQLVALNCDSPGDFLRATIDGVEVIRVNGDDPECGGFTYLTRSGDVSAFADNGAHTLRIESQVRAVNGSESRFFIDEVALDGDTTGPGAAGSCSLLPEVCVSEDFDAGLAGWTLFNTGPNDADWGTSDDGLCNSNPQTPDGNFTGGDGAAACVDSDAAGAGAVDAYLCGPIIDLSTAVSPALSFLHNYQIDGPPGSDDSFSLLVGAEPPSAQTIAGYDLVFEQLIDSGAAFAEPGFAENLDLSAYVGQSVYACFRYRADFDWYAQVDDLLVTAQACVSDIDTDGDGVFDSLDNCTAVPNADQRDTDGDNFGNVCDADFNNDCTTTFPDLAIMQTGFFTIDENLDLNGSGGPVNFADLSIMQGLFFLTPGPSGLPTACD